MEATVTRDYYTNHARFDRPCLPCGEASEEGDAYCGACGTKLETLADRILAWKPDPNARSLQDRPHGAALAKQVRTLLKPLGLRVLTTDGYYVDVKVPQPNYWQISEGQFARSIYDAPYQNQWHQQHDKAACDHLRRWLHVLYFNTAGTTNPDPHADYHYLSLPILTVNGL